MPKVLKTSETPNPQARRFLLQEPLLASGSRDFPTVEAAQADPLAARLFELPYVCAVFFVGSSVTITKDEDATWESLITPIADVLEDEPSRFPATNADEKTPGAGGSPSQANAPVLAENAGEAERSFAALSREGQKSRIEALLTEHVRPGLNADGGDLDLVDWNSHLAVIRYAGACGTCPSSMTGTLAFVEQMLQQHLHSDFTVHLA